MKKYLAATFICVVSVSFALNSFAKDNSSKSMMISESMRTHAVRKFAVFYEQNREWQKCFDGKNIGEMLFVELNTPASSKINFLEQEDSKPNISAVDFFEK